MDDYSIKKKTKSHIFPVVSEAEMMEKKNRFDQEVAKSPKPIRSIGRQKSRAWLLKLQGI